MFERRNIFKSVLTPSPHHDFDSYHLGKANSYLAKSFFFFFSVNAQNILHMGISASFFLDFLPEERYYTLALLL